MLYPYETEREEGRFLRKGKADFCFWALFSFMDMVY